MKQVIRTIQVMCSTFLSALLVASLFVMPSYASSRYLSVPIYRQEQTNWCWAASAKMVAVYLGGQNVSQCQYVKWGTASWECRNQTGDIQWTLDRVFREAGLSNVGSVTGTADSGIVTNEINNNSPSIVRWGWNGSMIDGHMLVVRGYTTDPGYLVMSYIDPDVAAYSSATYDWMKNANGHVWTHTRYGMRG